MTLGIIQARYASLRYPGKVLAYVDGARTVRMVEQVIHRVSAVPSVHTVVLAIPSGAREQPLHQWAKTAPCEVFIDHDGQPDDVLSRFAAVALRYPGATTICRFTADCPLLQPTVSERLITQWRGSGCAYGWLDTHSGIWPDGLDTEVFTRDLLMRTHVMARAPQDREHVTSAMRRMTKVYSLPADPGYAQWPKLSVDTPTDLERVMVWMS